MNPFKQLFILIYFLLFFVPINVFALDSSERNDKDNFDFGEIVQGHSVTHEFIIKNIEELPLEIITGNSVDMHGILIKIVLRFANFPDKMSVSLLPI